jgi:cold shock CspA family protein
LVKALGVKIGTKYRQGSTVMGPGHAYAELLVKGRPFNIPIHIQARSRQEITPLIIFDGKAHQSDSTSIGFTLNVPVKWTEGVPQTRHPGEDNLDVIFLDSELRVSDIQVGLVTRKGRFFLTAQRVFEGWARERNEGDMCFIPSRPEFAYPGMDYRETWKDMGEVLSVIGGTVSDFARTLGTPLDIPEPAFWKPIYTPAPKGWQCGIIEFFNAISGTGRILGEDGVRYFVHFSNILSDNPREPVRILEPMSSVFFRSKKLKNTKGPAVRSCKPTRQS